MKKENQKKVISFFNDLLNLYEFELKINTNKNGEKKFMLKDLQDGNLGEIEQEEFDSLADIIERLDIYHDDYIFHPLEEREEAKEYIAVNDWDLVAKKFIESCWIQIILDEIKPTNYQELNEIEIKQSENMMFSLLNEAEQFYKIICHKYINKMSNEVLIEDTDNKEIIRILIDNKNIHLQDSGKINNSNYKKYYNKDFGIHRYDNYEDLFYTIIKDKILNSKDLKLINEKGEWIFGLSFEEMQVLNLEYLVAKNYPLLEKHIINNSNINDFFKRFTIEDLCFLEQSLYLFYNSEEIQIDEAVSLISSNKIDFNGDIIRLSEGLSSYDDFKQDYPKKDLSLSEYIKVKTMAYFVENEMKDLMEYGSDSDEGLYSISNLYRELLTRFDIKYETISTDDVSDGKYITLINFGNDMICSVETKANNKPELIAENLITIVEESKKVNQKEFESNVEKTNEMNYNL